MIYFFLSFYTFFDSAAGSGVNEVKRPRGLFVLGLMDSLRRISCSDWVFFDLCACFFLVAVSRRKDQGVHWTPYLS